jgi:flagellar hook protein FlgE
MDSAFSAALSGLNANNQAINVVGNDLANLNTTGYKANQVEFSDLVSQQLGANTSSGQVGLGVGQINAVRVFSQGALQNTGGATDVAIQGNGFFEVKNSNGQTLYTRDGSFQVNANGQLVTATGDTVQGWTAVSGVLNPNGATGNISLPVQGTVAATATTSVNLSMNLDSRVATTDAGATFAVPFQVYDSQGNPHTLTATFKKQGPNTWQEDVSIPSSDLQGGGTGSTALQSATLTFDSNGKLLTAVSNSNIPLAQGLDITLPSPLANGSANLNINLSLLDSNGNSTITQFAESSGLNSTTQNGFAAGQISSVSLQEGGKLVVSYSNGQVVTAAQLALATVSNPESLQAVGNNEYQAAAMTATPAVGAANTGNRGDVVAGALEASTVDIAQEFTGLLTFERSYQADSRVITTSDQILQDTVNLIHG